VIHLNISTATRVFKSEQDSAHIGCSEMYAALLLERATPGMFQRRSRISASRVLPRIFEPGANADMTTQRLTGSLRYALESHRNSAAQLHELRGTSLLLRLPGAGRRNGHIDQHAIRYRCERIAICSAR